jgi:hypothetical protein
MAMRLEIFVANLLDRIGSKCQMSVSYRPALQSMRFFARSIRRVMPMAIQSPSEGTIQIRAGDPVSGAKI